MKVKRLEIQGFKSFKDKTVIHFDDGVTGIVGPNGCGKSNIVDAFFWVMGEQSVKHMRADGQIDLIFNGSEKYAPLGMAEVTMVLSTGAGAKGAEIDGMVMRDLPAHMKYEEISITRRLFRDATSEYMINGAPCRLKDIHELFMDTGAGPKAYSIIEQGQIAKIIQSKPEDRRVLIEEAAGIVKFKARKKESQKKIEATQANLARINDIIVEIERNLNSLERQAQKARQYKNWKEELLSKEMLVGRKKLFGLKEKLGDAAIRLQELEISEVEKRSSYQTAELRIENYKIQIAEAQRLVEDGQMQMQTLQREISDQNTKILLQKRRIEELENSNLTLDDELGDLTSMIARYNEEIVTLDEEQKLNYELFSTADAVLKTHQERLDEAKRSAEELGRVVEQDKRELMASMSRQNEISGQVHGLEARVDGLSVQINSLNTKMADRELECEMYGEKVSTTKETFETVRASADAAKSKEETLRTDVAALDTELKTLRVDEAQAREERMVTEAKIKALQELVDNHEGMRADVKTILTDSELNAGISGVLADKVEAHPGFEFALEATLRDFLENFIVENKDNAKNVLAALKERSLGRATFWAMDLLEQSANGLASFESLSDKVAAAGIEAKSMKDVIRLNHDRASSILPLFDRFFVVESLDDAFTAFAKTAGIGAAFVTREGDVVDRYGRITGGSTKSLEGGLISRKAELQKLSDAIGEIVSRAETLSMRLTEVETQLTQKREEFETISAEAHELDLQSKSAERDYFSAESQLNIARTELERLKTEFESLDTERKTHWEKLDEIRIELSSLEGTYRDREMQIEAKDTEFKAAQSRAGEIQAEIIQFKIDASTAQEKYKNAKSNLERVQGLLKEDSARKEEVESMMNRKLDEKDLVISELSMFEENMIELTERAQAMESKVADTKNEYEILNASMSEAFEEHRMAMKTVEEISTELNRLKLDRERFDMEYGMLYQSMFQRYGLEEDKIAPQSEEERVAFDELTQDREQELQAEVDRLHERIRKLGEVNVMAVEEYDEQKKRYDFLTGQREDLNKSIADLERAIERINKTSEERFRIAYHEINKRFERIFPIVFGGGWGKLELTNPEDMNETGVDIIAEPPGKKVASIQLMSGGEKALTAVALIFSIFLIKPSPFCVLDEVDAPLDDHNVGKFNALLKEMSIRSQFIIITHNKRTMELNDKLYGVTMEEPGVSKMVSIQIQ